MKIGEKITNLRIKAGMSQEQLAEKSNVSRSHISAIEAPGLVRPFSLEILFNIAEALEMDVIELLEASRQLDRTNKKED